jgi:hypothetical protein
LSALQWRVVLVAVVLMSTVRVSLRSRGFGRTVDLLAARSTRPPRRAAEGEALDVAEAVSLVAARRLVGGSCLPRSLVLWFLLRRRGIDAELVVGAGPAEGGPLPAHAWVEVDGDPLDDDPDVRRRFGSFGVPLPRLSSTPG